MPRKSGEVKFPRPTPTSADLLEYANVPVSVAAAYLGITDQAVRWGIRAVGEKHLPIGTPIKSRCIIPPQKLIAYKEGLDEQQRISIELKTIGKFIEAKLITFDDILGLLGHEQKTANKA